jgi:hypothetical protein
MRLFVLLAKSRLGKLRITICYLAIDFRLRRAFTGPLEQLAAASTCRHTKSTGSAKRRTEIFLSGTLSYAGVQRTFPDNNGQENFTATVHFVH